MEMSHFVFGARVNSMGSLYNISYFVKSWYFPLKVVAKQTNQSVLRSHLLKNAAEILLHSDQNLRGILTTIARALGG